ncbi:N2,N2-dimethylguanosine tRNA methyltransferase family protein [Cladophialophora carrionii]|uniref:tRNA (guanine(26)-N(2))-dimethyltransferase n=1 Tax=Cladophialophora carrionii TaxID=86049 RepID=A0A1C1CR81_9EURO|nr:N2,N2-dimethylguanosine tRNA methyltransferase family protein [Cladophialophora carrionii]
MASPAPPDATIIDGKRYRQVREGLASVLAPYAEEKPASTKRNKNDGSKQTDPSPTQSRNNDEGHQAVFYNPIQQFNRDLTVLAITVYGEGALLETQAKSKRKAQHNKNKRDGRRSKNLATTQLDSIAENGSEQLNARKRKADDIEDPPEDDTIAAPAKKPRANTDGQGDEEELPVAELIAHPSGDPHAQSEQPKQNGHPHAAEDGERSGAAKKQTVSFSILDALSATGLRALRYAKEIPFATDIVANDLSQASVESIELNIKHNQVEDKVRSNLGDARAFMYSKVGNEHSRSAKGYVHRFDVIDIDPYGTAAPFFDCSLQAIRDGGMLCVTCTDAGVFASSGYPEKTFALYGGMPIKGAQSHEGGLRLILNGVAMSAAKYGLAIEPLLSLSIDYYARLFIRVHRKQQDVKLLAGTTMTVYNCGHGCGAWVTQPLLRNQPQTSKNGDTFYKFSSAQVAAKSPNCEHCDSKMHLCGPMWAGPLHNPYFVQKMLEKLPSLDKNVYGTIDRLEGMLTLALEEDLSLEPSSNESPSPADAKDESMNDPRIIPRLATNKPDPAPFFFMPTYLAKILHCATPSEYAVRGALLGLGYRVSRSHCKAGSIKTNAPWGVLWEIIREFMRTKAPIKDGALKRGTPGWNILARLRGTERALVSDLKDTTKTQLAKCDSKEDLKFLLQGMLYRLENERGASNKDNGESSAAKDVGDEAVSPNQGGVSKDRSRSGSPYPSTVVPSNLTIIFDEKLGKEKPRGKLVRYQMNPRQFWGPMNRAGSAS